MGDAGKVEEPDEDERLARRAEVATSRVMARLWVWLCPGAGYAGLGWPVPAVTSFAASLAVAPLFAWYIYTLEPAAAWAFVAVFVAAGALWVVEAVGVWFAGSRPLAPRFLTHVPIVPTIVMWVFAFAWSGLFILNVRSLVLMGGAMALAADDHERFLYLNRAEEPDLKRGAVILFRTPRESGWKPDTLVAARIAAVPGDRIATTGNRLVVNGQVGPALGNPPQQFSHVIALPAAPNTIVVPENCYFVCSDNPSVGFDSRVLGWAERRNITSTRVWYLRGNRFLDRVE